MCGKPTLVAGAFQVLFFLNKVEAASEMGTIPGYGPELLVFMKDDKLLFGQESVILEGTDSLYDPGFSRHLMGKKSP